MIDVPDVATQRAIIAARHENMRELMRRRQNSRPPSGGTRALALLRMGVRLFGVVTGLLWSGPDRL